MSPSCTGVLIGCLGRPAPFRCHQKVSGLLVLRFKPEECSYLSAKECTGCLYQLDLSHSISLQGTYVYLASLVAGGAALNFAICSAMDVPRLSWPCNCLESSAFSIFCLAVVLHVPRILYSLCTSPRPQGLGETQPAPVFQEHVQCPLQVHVCIYCTYLLIIAA
jgi:hypothetical protein